MLPADIIRHTLFFLDDENLAKACMSSKKFSEKICNDNFWLKKIKQRYPELISPDYPGNTYIDKYRGSKTYWDYYYNLSQILSDPNISKVFQKASEKGKSDIVRILLKDKRIDPSVRGNRALLNASNNKHLEIVDLLLTDQRVKDLNALKYMKRVEGATRVGRVIDVSNMDPRTGFGMAMVKAPDPLSGKVGVSGFPVVSSNPELYYKFIEWLGPEYKTYSKKYKELYDKK